MALIKFFVRTELLKILGSSNLLRLRFIKQFINVYIDGFQMADLTLWWWWIGRFQTHSLKISSSSSKHGSSGSFFFFSFFLFSVLYTYILIYSHGFRYRRRLSMLYSHGSFFFLFFFFVSVIYLYIVMDVDIEEGLT